VKTKASAALIATIGCLTWTGSAWAAVTQSTLTVTSPSGLYVVDDTASNPPNHTMSGVGSTDGTVGDAVDVKCYTAPPSSSPVKSLALNVPVQADGSFSFTGSMGGVSGETCVLRAVSHGDTTDYAPGTSWPYAGPTLAIGQRSETTIATGPNAGALQHYYVFGSQLKGAFDYDSVGDCTIDDSYVFDPITFGSSALDYCNAWFWTANANSGPTRSELQVDGADAYLPGNVHHLFTGAVDLPGFPSLTYSSSLDPATGNIRIGETEQVVKCSPGGSYPPTSGNCMRLVPTGVKVTVHITQTQAGRVATVVQYFSSTDGHAHTVDLLEENDFYHPNSDGEFNFPWTGAGLQPYTVAGQVISGPAASGPGSFYIKGSASVPDGGESSPQGAVTYSNPPSSITMVTPPSSGNSWLELHYSKSVPATGSAALGFTYSDAFLAGEVSGYAAAAEAAFRPSVAITFVAPPTATTTVSGTATDATGISSVTVNGHAAKLNHGSWSARVSLRPGANTITAVATNVFGYSARAHTKVKYVAPRVSGLAQAHRTWREHGRARSGKAVGTSFSFSLSQPAKVSFVFIGHATGRRVAGRCVPLSPHNAGHASCRRTLIVGRMTRQLTRGHHSVRFSGRLGPKWLAPGRYTVVVSAGAGSAPHRLTFTIVA
jgi:Glucodextranase, domain B